TAASTAWAPLDTRHVVLQRDFERLGLRTEAYMDDRPTNPHRDEGIKTWRNVPAQVRGLSDVGCVGCGWGQRMVPKADGTFRIWGWNQQSQLGDGGHTGRPAPV